jgi:hypothetical protein
VAKGYLTFGVDYTNTLRQSSKWLLCMLLPHNSFWRPRWDGSISKCILRGQHEQKLFMAASYAGEHLVWLNKTLAQNKPRAFNGSATCVLTNQGISTLQRTIMAHAVSESENHFVWCLCRRLNCC